jgi:hypothetical protein
METLGPNPEAMLKSLIAQEARLLREALSSRGASPPDSPHVRDGQSPIPSVGGDVGKAQLKALNREGAAPRIAPFAQSSANC